MSKNLKKRINLKKRQRIKFIAISALISLAALIFIIANFKENIVFFYSPTELIAFEKPPVKAIRVGGLVKEGSIKSSAGKLEFVIWDFNNEISIHYFGIKPNLFREKQGIVAKGIWDEKNKIFNASELLAKHDENYMPPEVKKALKKN